MDEKQREMIQAHMKSALRMSSNDREVHIARTIGDVYDKEMPIPEVISAIARTERADVGEHIFYLAPDNITKEVLTISANCNVTQTKVTPNTRTELTFTDLLSPEYYVCIHDWLKGDHDVLRFYADAITEAMNRQEAYAVLQLVDAGAVAASNTFTLDSGKAKFDYPKLVEMARAVAKFGNRLVLVSGANVTTDIMLMDFDADTQREFDISKIVSQHIAIEDCEVDIDASTEKVIDPDVAYLIAVSDSAGNMPILFTRRKIEDLTDSPDTTAMGKERIVIDSGNLINTDSAGDNRRKLSRSKTGYEEYGAVLLNNCVVAKFTRA